MGCCYSCCLENKEPQNGDVSERARLLVDPVCNTNSIQRIRSDDYFGNYPEGAPPLSDEQSAKKKILQEAAADMIDVSGPYQMDQHEYIERVNQFSRRLATHAARLPPPRPRFLLQDIPDPEKYLTGQSISDQDYLLITTAAKTFHDCIKDFKVTHREDIVVPFEIP